MPNPPLKLKKQRKTGSIADALRIQWRALKAAEEALYFAGRAGDSSGVLSAVHAITQAAAGLNKLYEASELHTEVAALKTEVVELKTELGLRRVA